MFRRGQKVVCVDAGPTDLGLPSGLTLNAVYTVVATEEADYFGQCGLLLAEIRWEESNYHKASFRASRFRPVVARKTDISVFTAMLNPSIEQIGVG
jgi:hypothetical protein